jgi:hypothetical protein
MNFGPDIKKKHQRLCIDIRKRKKREFFSENRKQFFKDISKTHKGSVESAVGKTF